MLDFKGVIMLGKTFSSSKAKRFIEWFTFSEETKDGKSKAAQPCPLCLCGQSITLTGAITVN